MATEKHPPHSLDELVAESDRIQGQAAKLMEQIEEILQEMAARKAAEGDSDAGNAEQGTP